MRVGAVAAAAEDVGAEGVHGRAHDAVVHHNLSGFQRAVDVQGDHRVDAVQRAVLDHARRAADAVVVAPFLGGLEEQAHLAREAALAEQRGHAQQHSRVAVVAAGVHLARRLRGVGDGVLLQDRQRVHVGAHADHRAIAVAQVGHHARLAHAAAGLDTQLGQRIRYQSGRTMDVEAQLRPLVDRPPPLHQLLFDCLCFCQHSGELLRVRQKKPGFFGKTRFLAIHL